MKSRLTPTLAAGLLCSACPSYAAGGPATPSSPSVKVAAPAGFEAMLQQQEGVVDLFFGGRKLGQVRIHSRPGRVSFDEVRSVVDLIPNLRDRVAVAAALSGDIDAHSALVCSPSRIEGCGQLAPAAAGVIYDEDRFRVDVFVNPRLLLVQPVSATTSLAAPPRALSLATSFGGALAGSLGSDPHYSLQNHTVVGFGAARLRSDVSVSSGVGAVVENLLLEADDRRLRYSAGLFWAPGIDFVGQRKILGAGVGTQFDTRSDKDLIHGNPIIIFLSQPSRIDVLRDGQLLTSRIYEAGNQTVDTASLPDGSYELVLRIEEAGGSVREERRFFVKNARVAPPGQTIFFAYAGLLSEPARHRSLSVSSDMFYEAGIGRRLTPHFAVDATIIGVDRRAVAELGGTLMSRIAQVRLAGLASARGDFGALLQLDSSDNRLFSYNLEARRIWSRTDDPLLPATSSSGYAGFVDGTPVQAGAGSYVQATANIAMRVGAAQLGMLASYHRDDHRTPTYAYGPTLYWPIAHRDRLLVTLQANFTRTERSSAAFLALRVQFAGGALSAAGSVGGASTSYRDGESGGRSRVIGDVGASWQGHLTGGDVSVGAGLERNIDSSAARASVDAITQYGLASASVLQSLEGRSTTQYSLSLQTGGAVSRRSTAFGGRDLSESGVIVAIGSGARDARFEVLIDNVSRGIVRSGERLPIFLPPYREYSVRIRPISSAQLSFDSSDRRVVLYPGNVETMAWKVAPIFTVYGRAVRPDGSWVRDARLTSSRGISESDSDGYFQIQVSAGDRISFRAGDGKICEVAVGQPKVGAEYAPLGTVDCR